MGVRKSVNFNVSLEAYDKVKEIFPEVIGTEDNLLQLVTAYKFWTEHKDDVNTDNSGTIADLQKQLQDLDDARRVLATEVENLQQKLKEAQSQNTDSDIEIQEVLAAKKSVEDERDQYKQRLDEALSAAGELPSWETFKKTLESFPVALLERTASRLSEYYGREITPMQVLIDMFIRYTIERNAEWFYPFMLKDADIVAIAQEINPDVTHIKQIKKSLNLD